MSFGKISRLKSTPARYSFQSLESLSNCSGSDFLAARQASQAHRAGPPWPACGKTRREEGPGACFLSRNCMRAWILPARPQWRECLKRRIATPPPRRRAGTPRQGRKAETGVCLPVPARESPPRNRRPLGRSCQRLTGELH